MIVFKFIIETEAKTKARTKPKEDTPVEKKKRVTKSQKEQSNTHTLCLNVSKSVFSGYNVHDTTNDTMYRPATCECMQKLMKSLCYVFWNKFNNDNTYRMSKTLVRMTHEQGDNVKALMDCSVMFWSMDDFTVVECASAIIESVQLPFDTIQIVPVPFNSSAKPDDLLAPDDQKLG
jgi:hypothetical protein